MDVKGFKSLAYRIAKRNFPEDSVNAEWNKDGTQVILSVRRDRMVRLARLPTDAEEFQFSANVMTACKDIEGRFTNDRETIPC